MCVAQVTLEMKFTERAASRMYPSMAGLAGVEAFLASVAKA